MSDENNSEEQMKQDRAKQDMRLVEALLFAAAEPMTTNAIRERMPDDADVGGLLLELKEQYKDRGVHLVEMEGCWAFRTASDLGNALDVEKEVQRKLSRAAMETLAIIAYHQPVTRAEIENIRGVATHKGTLDVLMEAEWIKPGRRRDTPGRPLTWVTTTSFLDHFGLDSVVDLPGMDDLKASGLLDRRPAIDTIPDTGSLFGDDGLEDMEEAELKADQQKAYEEELEQGMIEDVAEDEDDLKEEVNG